jgi:drug/metabolite transporter (DMT)-like permease
MLHLAGFCLGVGGILLVSQASWLLGVVMLLLAGACTAGAEATRSNRVREADRDEPTS